MVHEGVHVNGPYILKESGRKSVRLTFPDGKKKHMLYSRFLMEEYLGRELLPEETVDHIDRDVTNDDINNLQILYKVEHSKLDAWYTYPVTTTCVCCGKEIILNARQLNQRKQRAKRNQNGPFCSLQCVGKYTWQKVKSGNLLIEIEDLPIIKYKKQK